jgi:hypothetical protein
MQNLRPWKNTAHQIQLDFTVVKNGLIQGYPGERSRLTLARLIVIGYLVALRRTNSTCIHDSFPSHQPGLDLIVQFHQNAARDAANVAQSTEIKLYLNDELYAAIQLTCVRFVTFGFSRKARMFTVLSVALINNLVFLVTEVFACSNFEFCVFGGLGVQ